MASITHARAYTPPQQRGLAHYSLDDADRVLGPAVHAHKRVQRRAACSRRAAATRW